MAAEEDQDAVVIEEMLEAMRWASNLNHDPSLSSLIRNLPADIVAEQVAAYRERDKPRKKDDEALQQKIHLATVRTHQQRMSVCLRFHRYCRSIGVQPDMKMPYGAMKTFIQDNLTWMGEKPPLGKHIHVWYRQWRQSPTHLEASETAVAEMSKGKQSVSKAC